MPFGANKGVVKLLRYTVEVNNLMSLTDILNPINNMFHMVVLLGTTKKGLDSAKKVRG